MNVNLENLPCSTHSRAAINAALASPPQGSLIVIEAPGDLAAATAMAFAESFVGEHRNDLHLAGPEGDRWTVTEVDELIRRPSTLAPFVRNCIVVVDAEKMASAAADHLLKTLEEPQAPTLFVFAVESSDSLLATIRSRSSELLAVEQADPEVRRDHLIRTGASPAEADEILHLTGPHAALAASIASTGSLDVLRSSLGAPLQQQSPAAAATQIAESLEKLAKATKGLGRPSSAASKKSADSAAKAQTRSMARVLLARWRSELVRTLAAENIDARHFGRVEQALKDIDLAEQSISVYVPVAAALAPPLLTANS